MKERRAGTTMWAPPAAALEHRVRGPSGGDAGEQKLRPPLTDALWGHAGRRGLSGPVLWVPCRPRF